MSTWSQEELNKINAADELQLAALRNDGTQRKPVTIWVVRIADDLYVRSVNGRTSAWFRGVLLCHEGRIRAGGVEAAVTFVEINDLGLQSRIDDAYRLKYNSYPATYVDHVNAAEAHAATLKLLRK